MAKDKVEKFPKGGIVSGGTEIVGTEGDSLPESIIPLDQLPEILAKQSSPLAKIMKSISELPQVDRLVLYGRIESVMNIDRDKASAGVDADPGIFEQAIKSL